MTESKLLISSYLSCDTIIKRLRNSTVENNKQSQTNYQQIFQGKIGNDFADITDIYSTNRNRILYKIKVINSCDNQTNILISNSQFEVRQVTNSLLKALLMPFGFILILLCFLFPQDGELFLRGLTIGALFIGVPLLYKLKPLSKEEFLSDLVIKKILELIEPIEIKLIDR